MGYLIHHRSSSPVEEPYFQTVPSFSSEESCSSPLFRNVFQSPTKKPVLIAQTLFPSSLMCFGNQNANKVNFGGTRGAGAGQAEAAAGLCQPGPAATWYLVIPQIYCHQPRAPWLQGKPHHVPPPRGGDGISSSM